MVRKERCEAIRSQQDEKSVDIISGNPLDSDKPARFRGIANAPKKPKRMSAIKRHVHQHRNDSHSQLDYIDFDALISNDVDDDRIECEHDCSQLSNLDCRLENLMKNRSETSKFLDDNTATTTEVTRVPPVAAQIPPVPLHLLLIHHHNFKRYWPTLFAFLTTQEKVLRTTY